MADPFTPPGLSLVLGSILMSITARCPSSACCGQSATWPATARAAATQLRAAAMAAMKAPALPDTALGVQPGVDELQQRRRRSTASRGGQHKPARAAAG